MKAKSSFYILILVIHILVFGCWNNNELYPHRIGQQVQLPSKIELYARNVGMDSQVSINMSDVILDTDVILLYFRADCPSCFLTIEKWNKKAKKLKDKGINFLIILGAAKGNFELFKWTVENKKLDISYPLILDLNNDFLTLNHFDLEFRGPLLLDTDLKIIPMKQFSANKK